MEYSIQILVILLSPLITILAARRWPFIQSISPIVLCFAIGILLGNINLIPISQSVANISRDSSILLSLPLLLFSSDIIGWLRQSKKTIISFMACVTGGMMGCLIASWLFNDVIPLVWHASGMMSGIYTGGTANLFAIAKALDIDDQTITLVSSAQIFWGALYLLFLLTLSAKAFGIILKKDNSNVNKDSKAIDFLMYENMILKDSIYGLLLTLIILGLSVLFSKIIWQQINETFIVIAITSAAILASLNPKVNRWRGPFEVGDYFLLLFSVAVGMGSNFILLIEKGGIYILFVLTILICSVSIHLLLARLFKIDRDTFIITSVAGLYGPVFIGQVARALNNKHIIIAGITTSLFGLAIGNYAGILVAYLAKCFLK